MNSEDIEYILKEVRKVNNDIGHYKEHSDVPINYNYSVQLTNGYIYLYLEEIKYKASLPPNRWAEIAARFRKR